MTSGGTEGSLQNAILDASLGALMISRVRKLTASLFPNPFYRAINLVAKDGYKSVISLLESHEGLLSHPLVPTFLS